MTFDASLIHPFETSDLVRLGQDRDGGYVLNHCVLEATQVLVGLGINADWSFEEDFAGKGKPDLLVHGYDFSVSEGIFYREYISRVLYLFSIKFILRLFRGNPLSLWKVNYGYMKAAKRTYKEFPRFFDGNRHRFFQLGVSNRREAPFVKFEDVVGALPKDLPDHSVFLKIDIELSEFRILDDVFSYSRLLTGMVIEFHDLDILWDSFERLLTLATKDFVLTHVHGNNYSGLIPGTAIPQALEVTLIHRSLLPTGLKPSSRSYPLQGLDFPNDPEKMDHPLHF